MLNKLALGGIRHRLRDYSVLFSGLMIAAAIFYMFMTLAMNKQFLNSNSPAAATVFIFGVGAVLLAIITVVYINYANKFLLSMRQKEYGMFMMLGAKSSKISKMIFVETFAIGAIASAIGILIGILATGFVGDILVKNMGMQISHFNSFYMPALLVTIAFFALIFIISAIRNSITLRMTKVLTLLQKDSQPTKIKRNTVWTAAQSVIGIILLAVGYFSMIYMGKNPGFIMIGVVVALITIVLGTYFIINSLTTTIINALKRKKSFSQKGLNNFTLSQLNFRIGDYTRILSVVSIMFALALGAITVGLGFRGQIDTTVNGQHWYDTSIINIGDKENAQLDKINDKSIYEYDYKNAKDGIYVKQSAFNDQPLKIKVFNGNVMDSKTETTSNVEKASFDLQSLSATGEDQAPVKAVSNEKFDQISAKTNKVTFVKTDSFKKNFAEMKAISKIQQKRFPKLVQMQTDKYSAYTVINGFYSGLEFMGFFLGIAFLAMLASCLMFKILSGAAGDVKRYNMLYKIGTRQRTLRKSINKEIAVLFAVPGVIGIVHVLVGVQMFKGLLPHPYVGIEIPFAIFLVLYFLYYFVTRYLYKKIVLK
ncbi:FtsX-like permease family protein [Companilactobacillus ginsenosidimutans]|uniref:Peptide ABC transporter permease/transmembrane protein n=1 Tax=Companilactobacillus ginsenosidimutans TaxID=1007676 RepID=A0A0H4QKF4_9LACO|nr:ABC transporter permease [Companilactobacillus ginsenosidimutans]AKP67551.1 peptide ABC transporter permease/transmembrane protein [Companilactobacillus ginsenosidimutans]